MGIQGAPQAVGVSEERSAQQIVEAFISALERLSFDEAIALVSDDVRWVNVPWTSATNKGRFTRVLNAMFAQASRFEVQMRDIHERGDGIVYTDRIDIFEGGGLTMTLPVEGEFKVRDGLITEWVDRFSWPKLLLEIGRSLPSVVRHRIGG
jgi:limonene-1,2-epoxide hydrolase